MTFDHALAKTLTVSAAVIAEVAAVQSSTTVSEWALKNAGLLLSVAVGVFAYGKLHSRVEALHEAMDKKASNEKVDAIAEKLDTIHDAVEKVRDHLMGKR